MFTLRNLFRPATLFGIGSIVVALLGFSDPRVVAAVVLLAILQNTAYSLQSRARMRSSNLYHAIAATLATSVFFATLTVLFREKVTMALLVPYTWGTLLGSLWGTKLSVWIEGKIGAVADLGAEVKGQALPFPHVMAVLLILFGIQFALTPGSDVVLMSSIVGATLVGNFLFSALTAARNTNSYWSHLGFIVMHAAVGFWTYDILLAASGGWYLFAPYVTGSLIGSIAGARAGKRIEGALKSSWDAHVLEKGDIPWPAKEAAVTLILVPLHLAVFGLPVSALIFLVFAAALAQNCAFSLISRARQRGHAGYIEWSSVFSNGIWFMTLGVLVAGSLAGELVIPYIMGTAIGSLLGQGIAMRIERKIGAVVDIAPPAKRPS